MATTLQIVSGNTAPAWIITCERAGTVINLTGCTVHLIIAKGTTITQAAGLATLVTPASGIISYAPLATDCPTKGTYKIDVKVSYGDGTTEILFEQLKVKTRAPIGGS